MKIGQSNVGKTEQILVWLSADITKIFVLPSNMS